MPTTANVNPNLTNSLVGPKPNSEPLVAGIRKQIEVVVTTFSKEVITLFCHCNILTRK